jgi:uncharacterized membrane protein
MWLAGGCNVFSKWLACGLTVALIWLARGYHVAGRWFGLWLADGWHVVAMWSACDRVVGRRLSAGWQQIEQRLCADLVEEKCDRERRKKCEIGGMREWNYQTYHRFQQE